MHLFLSLIKGIEKVIFFNKYYKEKREGKLIPTEDCIRELQEMQDNLAKIEVKLDDLSKK